MTFNVLFELGPKLAVFANWLFSREDGRITTLQNQVTQQEIRMSELSDKIAAVRAEAANEKAEVRAALADLRSQIGELQSRPTVAPQDLADLDAAVADIQGIYSAEPSPTA